MVTHTSDPSYAKPLKVGISFFGLNDSTYSLPLYSYNPFTDEGTGAKPIALNFQLETTNVGTFSVEFEDKDGQLDPDVYMRGNRVYIQCSKDNITWQGAFAGVVRSTTQNIYASSGRNLVISGYSSLIRLNERIVNFIEEANIIGGEYDRNDIGMFTHNIMANLLDRDDMYVYSTDDTELYALIRNDYIATSPISDWIPRIDAQLVTVNDAANSILEFSNSLLTLDPETDELLLYNPDSIVPNTGIFLLTNQINQDADDADYTMYPLEPYSYNISYDYPESGSRLIGSIGNFGDLCINEDPGDTGPGDLKFSNEPESGNRYDRAIANGFLTTFSPITNIGAILTNVGDVSDYPSVTAEIRLYSNGVPGAQVGSNMTLYRDGEVGKAFPKSTTQGFVVKMSPSATGPSVTIGGAIHFFVILPPPGQNREHRLGWAYRRPYDEQVGWFAYQTSTGTWVYVTSNYAAGPLNAARFRAGYNITLPVDICGGGSQTMNADPVFAVAHDRNMSNRLGVVERVLSNIPTHIKTRQSLNEYLAAKLYYAAKPRFTFDFPSVSMPNKLPKAGDIITHVDTKANVGLRNAPVQTGVISSVSYDFAQGDDGVLGLRKIGLQTTGIRRGSY